ncbi:MAG: hypothetical protein KC431_23925, partial [Myxococcales bacterium]|nr:hypothetical protein [Myxococcales bacterium]
QPVITGRTEPEQPQPAVTGRTMVMGDAPVFDAPTSVPARAAVETTRAPQQQAPSQVPAPVPTAELQPAGGDSKMGLYIAIGVVVVLAIILAVIVL